MRSCSSAVMLLISVGWAQIVPNYPTEVFLGFVGYTNALPGCAPDVYTPFSSVKVVLQQDLPSTERLANIINFVGSYERYLNTTRAHDYHPLLLNPVLRSYFFTNDIFTVGLEINGTLESLPATDEAGETFANPNYRLRFIPFHYLVATPNLIVQELLTLGFSRNADKTWIGTGAARIDYNILKYEAKLTYLTTFHTRLFLASFVFSNQYTDLPARSADGTADMQNPKLRETGYGAATGLRYSTFRWGIVESVLEYEQNTDEVFGANTYSKFKFNAKWENQYFTERFGYTLIVDYIRHVSDKYATGFGEETQLYETLARQEYRGDIMLILNLNRNVSIRPEFDILYRDLPGDRTYLKYRYWLHLHVLL